MQTLYFYFLDSKDSSNGSDDSSSTSKTENVNGALADRRPVSSLSLRSVSSMYFDNDNHLSLKDKTLERNFIKTYYFS